MSRTTQFVCSLAFMLVLCGFADAQTTANVIFKVSVVDKNLNLKNVPKFPLVLRKADDSTFVEQRISTSVEGAANAALPAGSYTVNSEKPLEFEEKSFAWEHNFKVEAGKDSIVELSNDNAKITNLTASVAANNSPRRRITEEAELFKTLRDGVVTVEGELGAGTGFIVDDRGLILTNQHVVSKSTEIRVRFDKQTVVRAKLIHEDPERDIAVLLANL
ncbi:MAG TPA: serine protease, partial [Pyrinomonadaceae bacterium]|nr:serine protease [Pyrinomonadaceae bacterium]